MFEKSLNDKVNWTQNDQVNQEGPHGWQFEGLRFYFLNLQWILYIEECAFLVYAFCFKGSRIVLWFSEILSISLWLAMKWLRNHIAWAHSKKKHLNANIVRKYLLCCWWLRNHLAWAHNKKKIFECKFCNETFTLSFLFLELMKERSHSNVTFVTKNY